MTLNEIIEGRSRLPWEEEVKAWVADKRQAEATYLHMVRLCDQRIEAAWQRMSPERQEKRK